MNIDKKIIVAYRIQSCSRYVISDVFKIKLGYVGVYIIFTLKHRLCVLVCNYYEAVLTCTHNLSFEQNKKIKKKTFILKFNCCICIGMLCNLSSVMRKLDFLYAKT